MQTPRTGYTEPPPTPTPTPGYDAKSVSPMFDVVQCSSQYNEFALDSLLVLFITPNSPSRCQDDYYWSYNPQNRHCYRVCKKTFKQLLAYPRQAYDTYDQAIGNYYGLSFEMAREFCQVKILNRSPPST